MFVSFTACFNISSDISLGLQYLTSIVIICSWSMCCLLGVTVNWWQVQFICWELGHDSHLTVSLQIFYILYSTSTLVISKKQRKRKCEEARHSIHFSLFWVLSPDSWCPELKYSKWTSISIEKCINIKNTNTMLIINDANYNKLKVIKYYIYT